MERQKLTSYTKYRWSKPVSSVFVRRLKYQAISLLYIAALAAAPLTVLLKSGTSEAATPFAASDVLGQSAFSNNAPNGTGGLNAPRMTALDATHHRLFVLDSGNYRVLVYGLNSSNALIDTIPDNVLGQPNIVNTVRHCASDSGGVVANGFCEPSFGLAYDNVHDRLFVADSFNHRVLIFDTSSITDGEDAVHVLGQSDFVHGDIDHSNPGNITASGLNEPRGIMYDSADDQLYVADLHHNRVLIFDTSSITDGEDAVHVLGQSVMSSGGSSTTQAGFNHPNYMALDATTHLAYVSDQLNHRVMIFDVTSITDGENAVHVLGQADFISSGAATSQAQFNTPLGVAVDAASHRLFVADHNNARVMVFDVTSITDGENAVKVLGQPDFLTASTDTNQQGFGGDMYGLSFDEGTHQLFVADTANNRILIFDGSTVSDNMNASAVIGQPDFNSGLANNSQPYRGSFGGDGLSPVLDSLHHRLFVSDSRNCRVLEYDMDSSNNLLDKLPDHVLGQPDFTTRDCGSTAAAALGHPGQVAYDSVHDRLFVPDVYDNYRVMVYDTHTITDGEAAVHVLGSSDINSAGSGALSPSTFYYMTYGAIAYDESTQQLYVADTSYNYRILIFDLSGGLTDGMDASHVLGAPDLNTAGNGNTNATDVYDSYPDMVVDSVHHRLFVSLYDQQRVMVFDVATITDGEPAIAVLGQPDANSSVSGTTQQGGGGPVGLGYDVAKNVLYVAEYQNARILIYDVNSVSDGQLAVGVIGAPDFTTVGAGYSGAQVSNTAIQPYDQANMAFDTVNRRMYYGDDKNARLLVFNFPNITLGDGTSKVTIPDAKFGVPYDYQIPITGTQGSVTCSLESGTLPLNVVITSDCHVKGTPGSNTPYTFTVKVTDDNGVAGVFSDSQVLGLTVEHAAGSNGSLADTGSNSRLIGVIAVVLITVSSAVLVRLYFRRNVPHYTARSGR